MKTKSLKLKDYIFLGLLSVVGLVIYLVSVGLAAVAILPLGTGGYLLSNGIFGLLGGIVFVFICSKVSARGRMTVFFAILLLAVCSLGGAYLPFIITTMGQFSRLCSRSDILQPGRLGGSKYYFYCFAFCSRGMDCA